MFQKLLEDRFQLKVHYETKELPLYKLVVANRGSKLRESKGDEPDATMRANYGLMTGIRATMPMFASSLSARVERQVVDETGLKGAYNFKLEFTPEPDPAGPHERRPPPPGDHPSIFTALQEQLGLNLKAGKGPVQVLVIDHAEKPTDIAGDRSDKPAAKFEAALAKPARPAEAQAIWEPAQGSPALSFEVASIKPAPDVRFPSWSISPESGMLNAKTDVKGPIEFAYGLRIDFQVSGGPGWLNSEKYTVVAKAARPASRRELQQMMQGLLADRFTLTIHRETKELPVLALVVGNKGPKLPPTKFESDDDSRISIRITPAGPHLIAQRTRMDAFVIQLMGNTGTDRIVVDRTGLTGVYDFTLDWVPDRSSGRSGDGSEPSGPTIFTALQEQLGLKLESGKGPVEVVVIDRVEKPSQN